MSARDVTNEQLEAMKEPARRAWLASMDATERMVVMLPTGWRYELIVVALLKHLLQTQDMPAAERLRFLEMLKRMANRGSDYSRITEAVVAAIAPLNSVAATMVITGLKLDDPNEQWRPHVVTGTMMPPPSKAFQFLSSWEVFWSLLRTDPALLDSVRLISCSGWRDHEPAATLTTH